MDNKLVTFVIIGDNNSFEKYSNADHFDFVYINDYDLISYTALIKTKYIAFIDGQDYVADNYFDLIFEKVTNNDFDVCFINNQVNYDYINPMCLLTSDSILNYYKPKNGDYIWSYIYSKDCLLKCLICNENDFNNKSEEVFNVTDAICDVIYFHDPKGHIYETDLCLLNRKNTIFSKNIIYTGTHCNCLFNGYITWLIQIGRAFANKYEISILYDDEMPSETYNRFSEFFTLIQYNSHFNYLCNNLSCTYSTYFFPKNIFYLVDNCLFIHGNMADFGEPKDYAETIDYYSRYIAVSKVAAEKAIGYFPTDNIEYILNPYVVKKENIKPHLRLVSAQRNEDGKRIDRIVKMAHMLTEMGIPYTWNVFMDSVDGWKNEDGLIYRGHIINPIDYVNDANYFVLLSDTEACPYSILEALTANIKIVCTPLEVYDELGVIDGKNGFIIPKDYFDDGNEEKLKLKLWEIYKNLNLEFEYEYPMEKFDGYNTVFKD